MLHSLTFTPFETSSVKGIWRLSWHVNPVRLRRTPPPAAAAAATHSVLPAVELPQDTVRSKASSPRACAAQPFVLHVVQTFLAQLIRVPPLCCKHESDDLSFRREAQDQTHPSIRPSIHRLRAAVAYFWECVLRRQGLVCFLRRRLIHSTQCLLSKPSATMNLFIVCKPDSSAV